MTRSVLFFVAGVVCLQWQPQLPHPGWIGLLFLLPLGFYFPSRLRSLLLFPAGFLWALLHAHLALSDCLAPELEGRDLRAVGVVASLPQVQEGKTRFEFRIERLELDGELQPSPGLVRLSWYSRTGENRAGEPQAGERWSLTVRLKRPHGFANPGGFDYEQWLFQQGIRATGYVRGEDHLRLGEDGAGSALLRLRARIREEIRRGVPEEERAALLSALVIGDRSGISREAWQAFTRSGTNHLIAISGLHIGMVAGLVYFLVSGVWRRLPGLSLRLPAQQAGAVGAMIAAAGYAALAGFAIPTQRALIMLAVLFVALLLKRVSRPFHSLALALFLVLLLDPVAVLSVGFWLSFAAVAAILYGMAGRLDPGRVPRQWGRVQWLVVLALIPVLMAFHLQVSLVAPMVNLLAVPLFTFAVVPLALGGTLLSFIFAPAGAVLLSLTAWILGHFLALLEWFAATPWLAWNAPGLPGWVWAPVLFGVLLLLMPRGLPGRWLGLLLLSPLLLPHSLRPPQGAVWLTMLDVGDGLAVVVQTARHTLLYDTGPRYSANFNAGDAVVVPYLTAIGVKRLDRVMVSNGDMDHKGGLKAVLRAMEVGPVSSGEPDQVGVDGVSHCGLLAPWEWDGVRFEVIHPVSRRWEGNNGSCVLRIEGGGGSSVLIPGDIERGAEFHLLRTQGEKLAADVVVVPHHGSSTSSTQGFVAAVQPRYALVSTGYRNRYGFPKPEVVMRWEKGGAAILNTAVEGAIELHMNIGGGLGTPVSYRQSHHSYWMAEQSR